MAKLILSDLTNLNNQNSAVNTINNNSTAIEVAMEKTLSRDGTSPNEMNALLDMNSNRIINLPEPISDTEPVRKIDIDGVLDLSDDLAAALEAVEEAAIVSVEAAEAAAHSADQAALYKGLWVDNIADLIADTGLTYDIGENGSVVAGDHVVTRAEGYGFEVAASGATTYAFATAGGVKLLARGDYYTPQQFAIVDDPSLALDQTTKIQNWFDACEAAGVPPKVIKPLKVKITSPVNYTPVNDSNVTIYVDISGLTIRPNFDGGLSLGSVSTFVNNHVIRVPNISRTGSITWLENDWEGDGESIFSLNAGLIIYNAVRSHIYIPTIAGFTIGVAYHSENFWFAYSKVTVEGELRDNRYNEVLRTIRGIENSGEFANENMFIGGRRGMSSSVNSLGDGFGTVIAAATGAYSGSNTNRWIDTCYELGAPADTYRVPVLLWGAGYQNKWENVRHESGVGPFGIAMNKGRGAAAAVNNMVSRQYFASIAVDHRGHGAAWWHRAGAFNNVELPMRSALPTFSSGPMSHLLETSGAATPRIKPPWFFKSGTSATVLRVLGSAAQAVTNRRALQLGGSIMVGLEVDTTLIKTFKIEPSYLLGHSGRYAVQCFGTPPAWVPSTVYYLGHHVTNDSGKVYRCDTNGTSNSSGGPTGTGSDISDGTTRWDYVGVLADFNGTAQLCGNVITADGPEPWAQGAGNYSTLFGGGYLSTNDNVGQGVTFTVHTDVKYVHVGISSGTAFAAVTGIEITGYPTYNLPNDLTQTWSSLGIQNPLPYTSGIGVVSAKPDTAGVHGFYEAGQIFGRTSPTSGQPFGDIVTTSGALASLWTINTVYSVVGHCVINDSGKVYELVTTGTSASSGGPTGTGKGITDGTCVWNYLCPKAAFTSLPNMP